MKYTKEQIVEALKELLESGNDYETKRITSTRPDIDEAEFRFGQAQCSAQSIINDFKK